MTASDFKYDSIYLSDLGYIICQFDESSGFSSSPAGVELTFHQKPARHGREFMIAGTEYEEPFQTTFSICKPCGEDFTANEMEFLLRWLNRAEYHEFILRDDEWGETIFYGTFNVEKVEFCGRVVGFNLQFITNSPYGWLTQEQDSFEISEAGGTMLVYDKSSVTGYIYPDELVITCHADGDLIITNSADDRTTQIKNCTDGEVLTIDKYVSTVESSTGRNVLNDFNFKFPRLVNTMASSANLWTFSLPCSVELKYTPARKVVF